MAVEMEAKEPRFLHHGFPGRCGRGLGRPAQDGGGLAEHGARGKRRGLGDKP